MALVLWCELLDLFFLFWINRAKDHKYFVCIFKHQKQISLDGTSGPAPTLVGHIHPCVSLAILTWFPRSAQPIPRSAERFPEQRADQSPARAKRLAAMCRRNRNVRTVSFFYFLILFLSFLFLFLLSFILIRCFFLFSLFPFLFFVPLFSFLFSFSIYIFLLSLFFM